jgi:hypothetical protein
MYRAPDWLWKAVYVVVVTTVEIAAADILVGPRCSQWRCETKGTVGAGLIVQQQTKGYQALRLSRVLLLGSLDALASRALTSMAEWLWRASAAGSSHS